jgi:hypothetical protein
VPNKAKALAFDLGGKQVFAARVSLPAATMPGAVLSARVARGDGGGD